jgi:hypothetical protein
MDEQMELLHADHLKEVSETGRESRFIYSEFKMLLSLAIDVVRAEGYQEQMNAISNLEEYFR